MIEEEGEGASEERGGKILILTVKVKPKSDTTNMTSLLRSDQDQREEMEFKRRVRRRAKKRAACSFVSGSSYIHTCKL